MNLKTGVLLILFGVALASVVVGQRLMIRSVSFDSGQMTRELSDIKEQNRRTTYFVRCRTGQHCGWATPDDSQRII